MHNDFKKVCIGTFRDAWNSKRTANGMRIIMNALFVAISSGITAALVILEIPYNLTTEIINEYKHNS